MAACDLLQLDVISSATVPTALVYQLVNPPAGASINANGIITWTPSEIQGPGTNLLQTIVHDNSTPPLWDTNSFTVVVNEVNLPPLLSPVSDIVLLGTTPWQLNNAASDSDFPPNTLSYDLVAGPTNATIDLNGLVAWTPTLEQIPSTNRFITVVTDFNPWAVNSQHLTATNAFTVTVLPASSGPPVTLHYDPSANTVQLAIQANPNSNYQVSWAPTVLGPWTPLQTITTDPTGYGLYSGPAPAQTAFFKIDGPL